MERPNYYGILPANVRYDKNLKPMEKIMYVELTALANKNGYCNATNSYFAELYEVGKNTVSLWINNLERAGYLKIEIIYEEGTKNVKERRIFISDPITKNNDTYHEKEVDPITKNNDTPITKNREDNNTSINNTRIILKEKINKKETATDKLLSYIDSLDFDENKKVLWKEWINYKKSRGQQYKNIMSIDKLLKKFNGYDVDLLEDIINKSIMNNYAGLFELNNNFTKQHKVEINNNMHKVKTKSDTWWQDL